MMIPKTQTASFLILALLLLLQGCSWISPKPSKLDNHLLEAMQKPVDEPVVDQSQQDVPIRVHYELMHKPLPNQDLVIALEILPDMDLSASAYAVKLSEGLTIIEPTAPINLGSLKAGETYHEEIRVKPVTEGLLEVRLFLSAEISGQSPQLKSLRIPIAVGFFQRDSQGVR